MQGTCSSQGQWQKMEGRQPWAPDGFGSPRRRGGLPAAGRLLPPGWSWAWDGGLSPLLSRVPPGQGRCVLFFVEGWGRVGGLWAMTLNNSFSFLEVWAQRRGTEGGPAGGDGAGMADRRVARVVEWRTVRAVAGGRSCPSGPAAPKPLAPFRRRPAPSRAPARSEQSQ